MLNVFWGAGLPVVPTSGRRVSDWERVIIFAVLFDGTVIALHFEPAAID